MNREKSNLKRRNISQHDWESAPITQYETGHKCKSCGTKHRQSEEFYPPCVPE